MKFIVGVLLVSFSLGATLFWLIPDLKNLNRCFVADWLKAEPCPGSNNWATRKQMNPPVTEAVVRAEDDRFYEHDGFDMVQVKQVVAGLIRTGHLKRGASTISQQLAKNLYLDGT